MANVKDKTLRVRLRVEVVVYRVEQVFTGRDEDGDQWEDVDTDVTAEEVIDEGTVLRGELVGPEDMLHSGEQRSVWGEQTPAQKAVEAMLDELADIASKMKVRP